MRTLTQHAKTIGQPTPAALTTTGQTRFGHGGAANSIHHLQRMIGSQALQRLLGSQDASAGGGPASADTDIDVEGADPIGQAGVPVGFVGALQGGDTRAVSHDLVGSALHGPGWDFSGISLSSPDQMSRPLPSVLQAKLVVGQANDPLEHEADRIADQVMRMPAPLQTASGATLQRKCAGCEEAASEEREPSETLQAKQHSPVERPCGAEAPAVVHEVLRSAGEPLDAPTRAFFEPRFGRDFSQVRAHADDRAAGSAQSIGALAYTVGPHIVFAQGQYAPGADRGRHLLAHELAHVMQQRTAPAGAPLRRQVGTGSSAAGTGDAVEASARSPDPAPNTPKCSTPSYCASAFCVPFPTQGVAEAFRKGNAGWLLAGISAAVDSRVVPLWREYIDGGSPPKDLTAAFGNDFTKSPTTADTTDRLIRTLKIKLGATPQVMSATTTQQLEDVIPDAIKQIGIAGENNFERMNFNVPNDIPGNLAGDIGADETSCQVGAQPSPFNDERTAFGTVTISPASATELTVTPDIRYRVKDTIDLCPGDCGTPLEQVATIPLSRMEASGIAGDIPFTVEFPAPAVPFTITPPHAAGPPPAPKPVAPPPAPSGPAPTPAPPAKP